MGGTSSGDSVPGSVVGDLFFDVMAGGASHSCGITPDDDAYCWGGNWHGQLGDGTTAASASPVPVTGGLKFQSIAPAFTHTCGLTTGGNVYCWGDNDDGQLGRGDNIDSPVPVLVAGSYVSVTTGDYNTCALASAPGQAYCWGRNANGEVGDGTYVPRNSPTAVYQSDGGDWFESFSTISMGGHVVCALNPSGVAYCWGYNWGGAFGNGTRTGSNVPTPVAPPGDGPPETFSAIAPADTHTCAINSAGNAYCWGIGLGNPAMGTDDELIPVLVNDSQTFSEIDSGLYHTCALEADGTIWCWGDNQHGQLGNNSTIVSNIPVLVVFTF
jgi:alpha-tubulin suppressor-like RCC1 family protein